MHSGVTNEGGVRYKKIHTSRDLTSSSEVIISPATMATAIAFEEEDIGMSESHAYYKKWIHRYQSFKRHLPNVDETFAIDMGDIGFYCDYAIRDCVVIRCGDCCGVELIQENVTVEQMLSLIHI